MADYSSIAEVKTSRSVQKTNQFLADNWILMDVCRRKGRPLFVLGRRESLSDIDIEALLERPSKL